MGFSLNIRNNMSKIEVGLAKVEEKINSIESLSKSTLKMTENMDNRLRKIEDWRFYLLGWTTAISFVVSFIWRKILDG